MGFDKLCQSPLPHQLRASARWTCATVPHLAPSGSIRGSRAFSLPCWELRCGLLLGMERWVKAEGCQGLSCFGEGGLGDQSGLAPCRTPGDMVLSMTHRALSVMFRGCSSDLSDRGSCALAHLALCLLELPEGGGIRDLLGPGWLCGGHPSLLCTQEQQPPVLIPGSCSSAIPLLQCSFSAVSPKEQYDFLVHLCTFF